MRLLHRFRTAGEVRTCRQVGRVLQAFLDGEIDAMTAEQVEVHLEACRRCGLESDVYREIKASIARSGWGADETTLRRLRNFGDELVASTDE